jgi:hypothetical protein
LYDNNISSRLFFPPNGMIIKKQLNYSDEGSNDSF